jgi:hypothetical protein
LKLDLLNISRLQLQTTVALFMVHILQITTARTNFFSLLSHHGLPGNGCQSSRFLSFRVLRLWSSLYLIILSDYGLLRKIVSDSLTAQELHSLTVETRHHSSAAGVVVRAQTSFLRLCGYTHKLDLALLLTASKSGDFSSPMSLPAIACLRTQNSTRFLPPSEQSFASKSKLLYDWQFTVN